MPDLRPEEQASIDEIVDRFLTPTLVGTSGTSKSAVSAAIALLLQNSTALITASGGTSGRSLPAFFSDVINVLDYGALGDGIADDAPAIRAADAAAAASGKGLYLPSTAAFYRLLSTVVFSARHVFGSGVYLDSGNRGTRIYGVLSGVPDLTPIVDFTGNSGTLVENLTVLGNASYSTPTLVSSGAVSNVAALPNYSTFANGIAAIRTSGSGKVQFRNVRTNACKVGLLLDNDSGHVSSQECFWDGLFGVYCRRNSEDYRFEGGGITGVFAGVAYSDLVWAGHNGGLDVTMDRVHHGFSPYCFYQLVNDSTRALTAGLKARFYSCTFEQVGEAIIKQVPTSAFTSLYFDHQAMTWGGSNYQLPDAIITAGQKQAYAFDLGVVEFFYCPRRAYDSGGQSKWRPSTNNSNGKVARIGSASVIGDSDFDIDAFGGSLDITSVPAQRRIRGARTERDFLRRTERLVRSNFRSVPTLIQNPETYSSALGSAGNCISPNGNWRLVSGGGASPTAILDKLSSWQASELADYPTPQQMLEELGDDPFVVKYVPGADANGMQMELRFANYPTSVPKRFVAFSFWYAANSCSARLACGNSKYLYSQLSPASPLVWQRAFATGQRIVDTAGADANYYSLQISIPSGANPLFIAGAMVSLDDIAPYNPYPGLSASAPTSTSAPSAGGAGALPATPKGYKTEYLDGVGQVRVPYY